jgi:cytochrome c oxidase cbb3-type subunit 3
MNERDPNLPPAEDSFRPHVYDGIQEYNKRLPNWWLLTFYGSIVFAIGYWIYYAQSGIPPEDGLRVERAVARIEAAKLAGSQAVDDASLWAMSRNAVFVEAGRETYKATCASCHGETLAGAIGPSLLDNVWIHGGSPTAVHTAVNDGILIKGMPAWGPVLGSRKVSEVVAFVMSHHAAGAVASAAPGEGTASSPAP